MLLGVNIDHIASLRQLRRGADPEPVYAALIAQYCGADSIVAHLREDRRHVQERDVFLLKKLLRVKLNLEMSIAEEIVSVACKLKPQQATLVPEKRQELTTEGGLDTYSNLAKIRKAVGALKGKGIDVSLFIDPEKKQIDAAKKAGVKTIELHTGRYADAVDKNIRNRCFDEIRRSANYASSIGLKVFAGHGLNYSNVSRICRIKEIEELNIGYSIICRAVIVGLEQAIREMKRLVS